MLLEKINVQYEAELALKAQAASEIETVEETDNVPVSDAIPSQEPDMSNVVENKEQNSGVISNQETGITQINESVPSVSNSKSEEAAKDSTCKKGALRLVMGLRI